MEDTGNNEKGKYTFFDIERGKGITEPERDNGGWNYHSTTIINKGNCNIYQAAIQNDSKIWNHDNDNDGWSH